MANERIILYFFFLLFLSCNKNDTTNQSKTYNLDKYSFLNPIDEEGMIYAQKGNKYGYIDIDQNIIIPFIYDELSLFSEGLASAKINGKYGFLNRKGKKIIDFQFDEVDGFYQSGLAIVQKNNKYGIITQKGTFIIPIVYENIFLSEKDSLICISKNKKWAFFSKKGKQVTNFIYDQITFSKKSLILIKKDKKIGYLDSNLTEKIPIGKYDYGTPFNNNGLAIVSKKNRFGVINNKDFQVIKTEFDSIGYLQEEYSDSDCFVGFKNDKLTLFDQKGNLIIEGIKDYFKDVCRLNNKVKTIYQIQKGNGLSGVIDEKGKVLIPVIYDEINRFRGDSVTTVMSKNKYGLIKSNNEIVYPINNDWILRDRDLDFYIVKKNDKAGIINKNLLPVLDFNYQDISPCHYNPKNLFIAKKNDKYGVIGLRGDIIIPFEYDELSNWVEYGPGSNYHFVTKNNKKGLITKGGKTIIPPVYDELRFINDQTIILAKNQKFGVVTIKNTLVIPFDYSKICTETFNLNLKGKEFYVQKNGKAFVIDNKNKMIRNKISAKEKELMNFEMKFLK